ncbi:MAG: DUF3369 domain-containing protein [Magnetococcales bacterium]|nr:DUF3369 domain-containing protein [Magnetococcales bacterium]
MNDDIGLFLADESDDGASIAVQEPWKVMVIDDDRGVHDLTSMVLRRFRFQDRGLTMISGYSGADAQALMREHPDTAIMLLDVVMESEKAGLEVVDHVRDVLQNKKVRIILRTGQPGQAPELEVITRYDINDYREKTELTQNRLITTVVAALRSYRDIDAIDKNNAGLQSVIAETGLLFAPRSQQTLSLKVLHGLGAILKREGKETGDPITGFAAHQENGVWIIHAGTGAFASFVACELSASVPETVWAMVDRVLQSAKILVEENRFMALLAESNQPDSLLFFQGEEPFSDLDRRLMDIYLANAGLAFHNMSLNREILASQNDLTITLGEIIEARSSEFGSHVRRVADSSRLMGVCLGLEGEELEWLYLGAVVHDLGKIVMKDELFQGSDTSADTVQEQVRRHTVAGFNILKGTQRKVMQIGATVAHQHHERWDGKGYPQGLRGEEIHRFARIVGLIDCFDALTHDRPYRKAWSREEGIAFLKKSRGTLFEPALVDTFFANLEKFLAIQDKIPDKTGAIV